MLTDNRAHYRPQEWYLIACDGDLVLKLAHNLMIGEDERGQTVLSPAPEDALLRITSGNGRLTLQALAMDWTFSEDGGLSVQHLTFVEGLSLRLTFPNSSLVITPDFVAGKRVPIDREIELKPTDTPTLTLTRVDEPIILVEPALLPPPPTTETEVMSSSAAELEDLNMEEVTALLEAASETSVDEAFLDWDHDVPDETVPDDALPDQAAPEPAESIEIRAVPVEPGDTSPEASDTGGPAPDLLARTDEKPKPGEDDIPLLTLTVAEAVPTGTSTLPGTAAESELDADADPAEAINLEATTVVAKRSSTAQRTLGGLIAAAALLAPMSLFIVNSDRLGVDFPLTNYRSDTDTATAPNWPENLIPPAAAQRSGEHSTAESAPVPALEPTLSMTRQQESSAVVARLGKVEKASGSLAPASILTESEQLLVASLLAEAKAYYDAGAIVTPVEANAVGNLTQVLHLDPTNEEGLRLMYQSAIRLIEDAETAHAAGDNFLARNLVEDVLGFHPEFKDARTLLDSWTRAPES